MPRVERLEHVERLGAAHLPHHDPVRPHPQRVAHELPDADLAPPLEVRRPGLQAHHVALAKPQLGGVLDRHDPLLAGNRPAQGVQRRGLPRARAAADQHRRAGRHAQRQEVGQPRPAGCPPPPARAARTRARESAGSSGRARRARAAESRRSRASRRAGARRRAARPRPPASRAAPGCARSRASSSASEPNATVVRSTRPARSTYTASVPFTITSSTDGSDSSGSSGPSPAASRSTLSPSSARASSGSGAASRSTSARTSSRTSPVASPARARSISRERSAWASSSNASTPIEARPPPGSPRRG